MQARDNLIINDPKLRQEDHFGRGNWYPYYAGYSYRFASDLLSSARLGASQIVLDPWNGSGTTTAAAAALGLRSRGLDLNPAVLIASKARLLSKRTFPSIEPLTLELIDKSDEYLASASREDDPLQTWFVATACRKIRSLDWAIQKFLVKIDEPGYISSRSVLESMSDLAAFFYVGLFRVIRNLCSRYVATNPTWVKIPENKQCRMRPADELITRRFVEQIRIMTSSEDLEASKEIPTNTDVSVAVASSEALPLEAASVDFVLSSPPYCTRIDYAIATRLELALVGYDLRGRDRDLRSRLIGAPLVRGPIPDTRASWGTTCLNFLDRMGTHESKASRNYYLKTHLRYFDSMFRSIDQLSRVSKPSGRCVLVVQDSYYKDVHNDLPTILAEMAAESGLVLTQRADYPHARSLGGIHPGRRRYRNVNGVVESVLCFRKE